MSIFQTAYGMAAVVALGSLAINSIAPSPATPEPFLRIISIDQVGDEIKVAREIPGPDAYADWRVTVVHENSESPICSTVAGPEIHQGWSRYKPNDHSEALMHIDVWVGDEGCLDRMRETYGSEQPFTSLVTWTPRDGRPPVAITHEIES